MNALLLPIALLLVASGLGITAWMEVGIARTRAHGERVTYSAVDRPVLVFNGVTIGDAVRIFNSRNEVQIIVSDPVLAGRKIGGSFDTHQPEQFAAALVRLQGIAIVRDGRTIRLEAAD